MNQIFLYQKMNNNGKQAFPMIAGFGNFTALSRTLISSRYYGYPKIFKCAQQWFSKYAGNNYSIEHLSKETLILLYYKSNDNI
ncbi:hypothetical protein T4B_13614 [Trichinella pseudospiralis]|uniref:Uncharacterized protein n=1 Tax=Trichinella pseudospiralis TaxID=6337 RepID=A0A0V1HA61_TRIPS|nr:hypothetical protein T4B_13614 [Trichinella pseudospiralis]